MIDNEIPEGDREVMKSTHRWRLQFTIRNMNWLVLLTTFTYFDGFLTKTFITSSYSWLFR